MWLDPSQSGLHFSQHCATRRSKRRADPVSRELEERNQCERQYWHSSRTIAMATNTANRILHAELTGQAQIRNRFVLVSSNVLSQLAAREWSYPRIERQWLTAQKPEPSVTSATVLTTCVNSIIELRLQGLIYLEWGLQLPEIEHALRKEIYIWLWQLCWFLPRLFFPSILSFFDRCKKARYSTSSR